MVATQICQTRSRDTSRRPEDDVWALLLFEDFCSSYGSQNVSKMTTKSRTLVLSFIAMGLWDKVHQKLLPRELFSTESYITPTHSVSLILLQLISCSFFNEKDERCVGAAGTLRPSLGPRSGSENHAHSAASGQITTSCISWSRHQESRQVIMQILY